MRNRFIQMTMLIVACSYGPEMQASPITTTVTIPTVSLIVSDDGLDDELYSKVQINGGGFQTRPINPSSAGSVREGRTINPNWTFNAVVDPRGRGNYDVPIDIELWDYDVTNADDRIDINPTRGVEWLSFTYNLKTGVSSLSSPQTGNAPGDQATLYFGVTSTPFQYLPEVSVTITPGRFRYTLTNESSSTFNIDEWHLPFLTKDLLAFELTPGSSFTYDLLSYATSFGVKQSSVVFNDLGDTGINLSVLVPVSEPSSVALLAIALVGFVGLRTRQMQV